MEKENKEHPQTGPVATITINGAERSIHRGSQPVSEIKKVGEVPLADDLVIIENGKMNPLPDDGSVVIKGGEVFISHPKSSQSS